MSILHLLESNRDAAPIDCAKIVVAVVSGLIWLGIGNIVAATELAPWQVEHASIAKPGEHSLRIDDRKLSFEVPDDLPTKSFRATEVVTRGDIYEQQLRKGQYAKDAFGQSWNFYPLGIPMFGSYAQFSILAKVYVKASVANREGYPDQGDFSKPEEMSAYLARNTHIIGHSTPIEEVVINGRKWYHYLVNSDFYPDALGEYYITGLAPDRYLEILVRYYPAPYPKSRYPTYPTEDQMPGWMKKTHKYKEQVINSIRITRQAGSNEPDLYEVEAVPSATTESSGAESQLISPSPPALPAAH